MPSVNTIYRSIKTTKALEYLQDMVITGNNLEILGFAVSSQFGELNPDRTIDDIKPTWYPVQGQYVNFSVTPVNTGTKLSFIIKIPPAVTENEVYITELYIFAKYKDETFLFGICQTQTTEPYYRYIPNTEYTQGITFDLTQWKDNLNIIINPGTIFSVEAPISIDTDSTIFLEYDETLELTNDKKLSVNSENIISSDPENIIKTGSDGNLYTQNVLEYFKYMYQGVNLEEKFADEIANYPNKYAWLEARKQSGDYSGIYIGDYIYTTILGGTVAGSVINPQTFKCRIIGLDTYSECGDTPIGHMIYFKSDECIDTFMPWNPSNCNNGSATEIHPWLQSGIYARLNGINNARTAYGGNAVGANASSGGILQMLPIELQAVLKQKRMLLDQRYSAQALLIGSTNWDWKDGGKLWLPLEVEVYGHPVRSNLCQTQYYWFPENGLSIQFPWFIGNCNHRICKKSDGSRCAWWLSSPDSTNTTNACLVHAYGEANSTNTTYATISVPLCFCI